MKKMHLQKLTLAAIGLFLTLSCSKDEAPAPVAKTEVTIGTQVWATKNLDVATYSDGTPIPEVDAAEWWTVGTGAWCYYENNTANGKTYGKLYNWFAVAGIHDYDPNTPNKMLAPTGWHVPSDAEWTTLRDYLGGESVAGSKMKATGNSLWVSFNTDATNSSGFSALPAGFRDNRGSLPFIGLGDTCVWWSSSELLNFPTLVSFWKVTPYTGDFQTNSNLKNFGFSVRCVKD